jgi:hypothetical protein
MAIVRNESEKDIVLRWDLLPNELVIPAKSSANIDDYVASFFFGYQIEGREKYTDLFLSRLLLAGTKLTREEFAKISFEPVNVAKKSR